MSLEGIFGEFRPAAGPDHQRTSRPLPVELAALILLESAGVRVRRRSTRNTSDRQHGSRTGCNCDARATKYRKPGFIRKWTRSDCFVVGESGRANNRRCHNRLRSFSHTQTRARNPTARPSATIATVVRLKPENRVISAATAKSGRALIVLSTSQAIDLANHESRSDCGESAMHLRVRRVLGVDKILISQREQALG